jgi:hypothetical protein
VCRIEGVGWDGLRRDRVGWGSLGVGVLCSLFRCSIPRAPPASCSQIETLVFLRIYIYIYTAGLADEKYRQNTREKSLRIFTESGCARNTEDRTRQDQSGTGQVKGDTIGYEGSYVWVYEGRVDLDSIAISTYLIHSNSTHCAEDAERPSIRCA